jgi:serine/threonine protein kinase
MPKNIAPQHPALNAELLTEGRLLPPVHEAWEQVPSWHESSNSTELEPQKINKKKRNAAQKASVLGSFVKYPIHRDRFDDKIYIGEGCFGKVKFCQDQAGGWFVVKTIKFDRKWKHLNQESRAKCLQEADEKIKKEAFFLNKRDKLEAFYVREKPSTGENVYYLIQKYVEGETVCQANDKIMELTLTERVMEFKKLLTLVNEINDDEIIHGDLNAGNIIRKKEGSYDLVDFGSADVRSDENELTDLADLAERSLHRFFTSDERLQFHQSFSKYRFEGKKISRTEFQMAFHFALSEMLRLSPSTITPTSTTASHATYITCWPSLSQSGAASTESERAEDRKFHFFNPK